MGLNTGRKGRNSSKRTTNSLPKIGRRKVKSQYEFDVYKSITGLVGKGTVEYEVDKLSYTTSHDYIPDLTINLDGDRRFYIECKGYFPYSERAKMIAVKEAHPELDIRILFYRDTPSSLGKGSKMKPTEWATKYGFPSSVKEVPLEWFQ